MKKVIFILFSSLSLLMAEKPNIIFILLDDLGKEWISCYGASDIKTPNIDKLAADGLRFNNFYTMPQCTPTRIALFTGQYPFRNGWVNHWDTPRWGGAYYDWQKNPNLAKALQNNGYKTASAGKWQVNDFRLQPDAMTQHGFDDFCMWTGYEEGVPASDERYWNPYIHTKSGSKTYEKQFGEDIFSDFLIDFMKKNQKNPFFLYYAMCLPHSPLVIPPGEEKLSSPLDKHKAMVRYADTIIAKIKKSVDDLGLSKNTLIIVTTDNGTSGFVGTLDGRKVAGGKTKYTENGINNPLIISGMNIPKGVSNALVDITDFFPTLVEMAKGKMPENYLFDGQSFAEILEGKSLHSKRQWILSMGGENKSRLTENGVQNEWYFRDRVIRNEQYKLWVSPSRKAVKIVDLKNDPYEEVNLIDNPELAEVVKNLFKAVENNLERDNSPIYTPLKGGENLYKTKIFPADTWQSGKPGDEFNYKPHQQRHITNE